LEMGLSARNGIAAALLAKEGYTGKPDVLEAPRGLLHIMTAGKAEDPQTILDDWGKPFRLLEAGIKQYPCCYHMQRLIEAGEKVRAEHGIGADDIEHISVEVNAFFPTVVQHPEPSNEMEAQFSLPQGMAAAFLEDKILPSSFSRERIAEPAFKEFRSRVETVVREDWGWVPTGWTPNMVFTLKDGREIVENPVSSKGQPPNLLPFDAVIEKYENCLSSMLPRASIDDSLPMLAAFETVPDISAVVEAVRP
jgi:2-methylcitrate dehydratase